jgi:hypothetical protein
MQTMMVLLDSLEITLEIAGVAVGGEASHQRESQSRPAP